MTVLQLHVGLASLYCLLVDACAQQAPTARALTVTIGALLVQIGFNSTLCFMLMQALTAFCVLRHALEFISIQARMHARIYGYAWVSIKRFVANDGSLGYLTFVVTRLFRRPRMTTRLWHS